MTIDILACFNINLQKRFSFNNRINDIIQILCDKWLNETEPNMNMILKNKILEIFTVKCDNFISFQHAYFLYYDDLIPYLYYNTINCDCY